MTANEPIMEVRDVSLVYRQRHTFFRHTYFTALEGLSFDILQGETLGIVGRNGSGKSSLLRLLAGIYAPDTGNVTKKCDSVTLLSLALGFDQELSGRSNAIVSGMFMGAKKREVLEKLDEIIEFADIGEFIDEPLKTYSSGMRARLGFSVALKMQTDLLLIDEVLGVGDIYFKRKAEEAMVQRLRSKQTVVLVSHSTEQVKRLCDRVIWLDKGRLSMLGGPTEIIEAYEGRTS